MTSSNMMKSLRRAAKANQEGSDLLEVGDTTKALKCFRSALKQLNEGCQNSPVESLPSALDQLSSSSTNHDDSLSSLQYTSLIGTAVLTKPIRLGEDFVGSRLPETEKTPLDPTLLYSEAFVFDDDFSEDEEENIMTIEKHSFCSAVFIYNTALALHQKAGKEEGHKAYLKALLFYAEAMNLLRPVSEDAESFRVIQEILKNQADIYYRVNDMSNVQRVWEELSELTRDHNLVRIQQRSNMAVTA